jgi:cyclopropane-fatty-acyl-phospholipid synthase
VVGRLVEQQQVGLLQKQLAQRDASAFAAGEHADVGVARRQPQRVHRHLELAVQIPRIGVVQLLLQLAHLVQQLLHLVRVVNEAQLLRDLVETVEIAPGFTSAFEHVAPDVLGFVERRLLQQDPDRVAGRQHRVAVGRLLEPGHDLEHGRLAGAVGTDDADLGARQESKRDVVQDDLVAMRLADLAHLIDELRHRCRVVLRGRRCQQTVSLADRDGAKRGVAGPALRVITPVAAGLAVIDRCQGSAGQQQRPANRMEGSMTRAHESAAVVVRRLVTLLAQQDLPLRVRAWDGSVDGPDNAVATIVVRTPDALRRVLWAPNELGIGRAFVAGEIDVEGELEGALQLTGTRQDDRPDLRLGGAGRLRLAAQVADLGAFGLPLRPPPEEAKLTRRLHSRDRDAAAIQHHYDVSNDFYRLVLGESMVYSCAYWESRDFSLEQAQDAKLDLVCRKLGLEPGKRLLDVGCGWGSLAIHAATRYGADVVGVTLSPSQAELARERVAAARVADRVEIRLVDYRDVTDGPYDAIASVGMAEHLGASELARYAGTLHSLLRPLGRVLNHAICRRPGPRPPQRTSFLQRYVFPDGDLQPIGLVASTFEEQGFEVRDIESLREHYALTLRHWVRRLEINWDEAVELAGEGRARVWRLYMASSALAFDAGRVGVDQTLAVRPTDVGVSGMPMTRTTWLDAQQLA